MHINKGKTIAQCIHARTAYAMNPDKTENGELISSYECTPQTVESEFLLSKRQYHTLTGRKQEHDVIAYQVRQAFKPGEVTPEEANRIGYEFAMRFTKGNHAFIVCTHTDHEHLHNHIIWDSTVLDCTRKFRNFWGSTKAVRKLSDLICAEHHLSVIAEPKRHGMRYDEWLGDKRQSSHRDILRSVIDEALSCKPKDFESFIKLIEESGYSIKHGKHITFVKDGQRNIRMDSLGEGYSEYDIRAVISGKQIHQPKKKYTEKLKPNLIAQIESKLGTKGAGYDRWVKRYSLKQMSQAVLFLHQHGFTSIDEMKQYTSDKKKRYDELLSKIKSNEKRMAEIAELRMNIINYSKTREVYRGYKESRYSQKYLAEHESDILLHKSAKEAFNKLGLEKLPTVKSLQAEYAALLNEKKAAYSEYNSMKKELREMMIYQSNIEYILSDGEVKEQRKHEQERE